MAGPQEKLLPSGPGPRPGTLTGGHGSVPRTFPQAVPGVLARGGRGQSVSQEAEGPLPAGPPAPRPPQGPPPSSRPPLGLRLTPSHPLNSCAQGHPASPVHRAGARGRGRSGARTECRPGREAGSLAGGEFPAADVGPAQPSSRRRGAGRPSCRRARDRPQRPALPAPAHSHRPPRRVRPRCCCGGGLGRGSREPELGVGFGSTGNCGSREVAA